jgi:transcriptional regulator with XRE-family HTH domain
MVDDEPNRTNTVTPGQFGRRLREHREQQRITIEAIASSTKIKASLFAGLERGDIAEWPAGIFRRAFVREYARAIGLPPESIVAEFLRVFGGESVDRDGEPHPAAELRLTLAGDPDPVSSRLRQAAAAVAEAVGIAAAAACLSWIAVASFGTTCGVFAFLYYPLASAFLGCTPATWYLQREAGVQALLGARPLSAASARRPERMYLVKSAEPERPAAATESAGVDADSRRIRTG